MIRTYLIALMVFFAGVRLGHAQTGALVSGLLEISNQGATAPFTQNAFTVTPASCNQTAPTVPATVVNPTKMSFDDRNNVGKVCTLDQGTFLLALPTIPGTYTATATVTDDRGMTSARSAASNPFGRAQPPSAPTGLRITP